MAKAALPPETFLPQIGTKDKANLTKLQKQFNSKIAKINKLKAFLVEQEELVQVVRARTQKEIQPLVDELLQKKAAFVKLLDQAYESGFFRKKEKEKLATLIDEIAFDLIDAHGMEELTEIFDKYAEMSFEEESKLAEEESKEMTKEMLKEMFGLDIQEEDLEDFDAFQAKLEQQMEEQQQARDAQRAARKKTKAQEAKDKKLKAEFQNISKATRRIYTDLVKLLHPDKELDAGARVWKEEAMKKVTIAYNNDDFYELLRLQVEFMEGQETKLSQVPEDHLKYYVQMLNEQIKELENKQYNFLYGPDSFLLQRYGSNPKQMETRIRAAKKELRQNIQQLKEDLVDLKDPHALREFLKIISL